MPEPENELEQKFSDLREKFNKSLSKVIVPKSKFSREALKEFARGFDSPVVGIFEFLKNKTASYFGQIECRIKLQSVFDKSISSIQSYDKMKSEFEKITLGSQIVVEYHFKEPYFPGGNMIEAFKITFNDEFYEMEYEYFDNEIVGKIENRKEYMTHLESAEIIALRDKVSEGIIDRISSALNILDNEV